SIVYIFFQAETGIRDRSVTGVQTCALPILQFYASFLDKVNGTVLVDHVHEVLEKFLEIIHGYHCLPLQKVLQNIVPYWNYFRSFSHLLIKSKFYYLMRILLIYHPKLYFILIKLSKMLKRKTLCHLS